MIGDRDLLAFRRDYYRLFVSLLWREPAGDLLATLGHGIEDRARAAEALHPLLGAGWRDIAAFLAATPGPRLGEAAADEYTRLFLSPFSREVNPYESFYLTGYLLDRPLAVLRSELAAMGIAKEEGYAEPEDFLAFELDVMRRLIDRQAEAADPDGETHWLNVQATFLKRHLLVWAPKAALDLAGAGSAAFYRGVGRLLQGFLEMERELFEPWGAGAIETLEEARQRFAGSGEWKGPLFDPPRV